MLRLPATIKSNFISIMLIIYIENWIIYAVTLPSLGRCRHVKTPKEEIRSEMQNAEKEIIVNITCFKAEQPRPGSIAARQYL